MNRLPGEIPFSRRRFFGIAGLTMATAQFGLLGGAKSQSSEENEGSLMSASTPAAQTTTIRPFNVAIPEADLADLRRRIAATRWPSGELVADRSQGVQLATLQALSRYWSTEHDW